MSNWFTRIFCHTHAVSDGLVQTQREALLDLFNFCMCADGKIVVSEDDFISYQVARFHWESTESVAIFSAGSIARGRRAHVSEESRVNYANDINDRLLTTELKSDALDLAKTLFVVDGEYAQTEKEAFKCIARAFDWPL